jgi:predicted  nucleic acid-binding Zn-ribbon protein
VTLRLPVRVGLTGAGNRRALGGTPVMTAVPQDQWRLLDVQDHDIRLTQLDHRRGTLPEYARVSELEQRLRVIGDQVVSARTVVGDLSRELTRAEADVEVVRQRAARDRDRLDAGKAGAKELQALQHEVASLAQRQSVLEDVALEVMERLEAAQTTVTEREGEQRRLQTELAEVMAARDAALAVVDAEADTVRRARADAAAGLPAGLLALYEKIRESSGGVGAARLRSRRCEGCRMEITPVDLGRFRAAAENVVLRCEECGRILVRTPDSGL